MLQVISSSLGELQPVFEAMLEKAVRICDAEFGNIHRWDGNALHLMATHNTPPAFAEYRGRSPWHPKPRNAVGRTIATKKCFTSPILQQKRPTLNDAIRHTSQLSNLGAYGRFWLSRC